MPISIDQDEDDYVSNGRDESNLESLCEQHYANQNRSRRQPLTALLNDKVGALLKPAGLEASQVPLTIVCGAAGAGKNTYIARHAGPDDTVIDMDIIRTELGIPEDTWSSAALEQCLMRRNEKLAALASSPGPAAWFIVSAPTATERDWWREALRPIALVVVLASARTCIDRINATRKGDHADRSIRAVKKWWLSYDPEHQDQVFDATGT